MNRRINKEDLEGRLVLISSDSDPSRKFTGDISNHFNQDHEVGGRVVRLDVEWIPYANGEENFKIVDPNDVLSIQEIEYVIKHGDNYFLTKLEQPFLADPLKYLLNSIIETFGREYYNLKQIRQNEEKFRNEFLSFISASLPVELKGVVKQDLINKKLIPISNKIIDIFEHYEDNIIKFFEEANGVSEVNPDDERLDMFKSTLSGYLSKEIIQPKSKQIFVDELRAVSYRVGKLLENEKTGRFNWIIPWLDGRSDHNKPDPYECIRAGEYADLAANTGVNSLYSVRMHSKKHIDFFEEKGVCVVNLTQTNEYISLLCQDLNINFNKAYAFSPDEGGLTDAMVFAREMYRRTDGEFTGRVVVFKKKRVKAGQIAKMEFLGSYTYNPEKERKEDLNRRDDEGNLLPYDIVHSGDFKNDQSSHYIGNLFEPEFNVDQESSLIENIKGHMAIIRDDIVDSARTMARAAGTINEKYNSKVYGLAEHAPLTGNAIEKLGRLHRDGVLEILYTSTSIVHPHIGKRPWHVPRTMSDRFKKYAKKSFLPWLKENHQEVYSRLDKYLLNK
ncbi:MAG: hypothetical protein KJ583_01925 [Nanoarchaeota archaeon]|nr:hypothetical protein [Nanoarchaeota archaeon]MBU1269507.1 hypothetical protein [Nanoarchaeota archaeon]MBU1604051.1 hypothetical protein [Nanoarchaeota archaeon]MBU2442595.1 hypothetical protein [Nanoarchaeota archaeon]